MKTTTQLSSSSRVLKREEDRESVMRIVRMTPGDISSVMEIECESQLEPWSAEQFLEELDRSYSHVLVARMGSNVIETEAIPEKRMRESARLVLNPDPGLPLAVRIAGYICFWCIADEVQILNLAVRREYRRLGIGRSLLAEALMVGCELDARLMTLEVRKSNLAARLLYENLGFYEVGERPGYYGGLKEPAVLMSLDLKDGCGANFERLHARGYIIDG